MLLCAIGQINTEKIQMGSNEHLARDRIITRKPWFSIICRKREPFINWELECNEEKVKDLLPLKLCFSKCK